MTTITRDDDIQNIYTVPVGICNLKTSVEEFKYDDNCKNTLIVHGKSISKKEPSKISLKKTMRLYIVPGAHTLLYQQGNHNSFIYCP